MIKRKKFRATYAEGLPATADAAFRRAEDPRDVCFVRGCAIDCWHVVMSAPPRHASHYSLDDWGLPCHIHSAFTSGNYTYFFTGAATVLRWRYCTRSKSRWRRKKGGGGVDEGGKYSVKRRIWAVLFLSNCQLLVIFILFYFILFCFYKARLATNEWSPLLKCVSQHPPPPKKKKKKKTHTHTHRNNNTPHHHQQSFPSNLIKFWHIFYFRLLLLAKIYIWPRDRSSANGQPWSAV